MPSSDVSQAASCTTCHFSEDFSNYWTANLYFKARNGSYKRVPQIANQGNTGDNGGITVYYTSPGSKATTAFKPVCSHLISVCTCGLILIVFTQGFRMLTGDSMRRKPFGLGKNTQSCFRCYSGPNFGGNVKSPCFDSVLDTESLPSGPCLGGIRSNIIFPK